MLDKKSSQEIEILRQGGKLLGKILRDLASEVKPGKTGQELSLLAEEMITKVGGKPSFKGYKGFPNGLCVSVNQTVVHGIPSDKPFLEGDVVGLDIGMEYKGLHTDTATTVAVGKVSKEIAQFLKISKKALEIGIKEVGPDKHIGDVGKAIEEFIKPYGYSIVRDLAGHGVGRSIHEEPLVPNYDPHEKLEKMFPGLVIAVEPMIIMGKDFQVKTGKDRWAVNAADGSLTAHFEHSVAVTEKGHLILTE